MGILVHVELVVERVGYDSYVIGRSRGSIECLDHDVSVQPRSGKCTEYIDIPLHLHSGSPA